MKVSFGMKAHSGWTALVVLGKRSGVLQVLDRYRMELVEEILAVHFRMHKLFACPLIQAHLTKLQRAFR